MKKAKKAKAGVWKPGKALEVLDRAVVKAGSLDGGLEAVKGKANKEQALKDKLEELRIEERDINVHLFNVKNNQHLPRQPKLAKELPKSKKELAHIASVTRNIKDIAKEQGLDVTFSKEVAAFEKWVIGGLPYILEAAKYELAAMDKNVKYEAYWKNLKDMKRKNPTRHKRIKKGWEFLTDEHLGDSLEAVALLHPPLQKKFGKLKQMGRLIDELNKGYGYGEHNTATGIRKLRAILTFYSKKSNWPKPTKF